MQCSLKQGSHEQMRDNLGAKVICILTSSLLVLEGENLPVTLLGFLELLGDGVLFGGGKSLPARFQVLDGNVGRSVATAQGTAKLNTSGSSTEHECGCRKSERGVVRQNTELGLKPFSL